MEGASVTPNGEYVWIFYESRGRVVLVVFSFSLLDKVIWVDLKRFRFLNSPYFDNITISHTFKNQNYKIVKIKIF